jgi:hypothetical protein
MSEGAAQANISKQIPNRHYLSCPGRGAAFFMPLRRAGTLPSAGVRYGPGSAAHHAVKNGALRCVRGTEAR